MSRLISRRGHEELAGILDWYVDQVYGKVEGPGVVPFYCDPQKVGLAAVDQEALARADEAALFKLFVSLAMYQARRDVLIQEQQRGWSRTEATSMLSLPSLRQQLAGCPCPHLTDPEQFEQTCTVSKHGQVITCGHPNIACPVRLAATVWGRMADLGKLPTSAFRKIWAHGGITNLMRQAEQEPDPTRRIELVVEKFSQVHRVGRKLATLFVSTLSTPALAPGLSPWSPMLDGNLVAVLDTHATRAVDHLAGDAVGSSYQSRVDWLHRIAGDLDLKRHHRELPTFSPRIIQQALYVFCSKSNRLAWGLACSHEGGGRCSTLLCPFK